MSARTRAGARPARPPAGGRRAVVNTSATLPAALPASRADGMQLRLHLSTSAADAAGRWVVELRRGDARFIGGRAAESLALETVALPFGHVQADAGWTRHVVTPQCGLRVVDGLLTGRHEPATSHLLMLEAVGGQAIVEDSCAAALEHRLRWHEFGDVHLILRRA